MTRTTGDVQHEVVDAHCHFLDASALMRGPGTLADLVAAMDTAGVSQAVCSAMLTDPLTENRAMRDACDAHPGRLWGYVNLDPRDVDGSLALLSEFAPDPRFRGVKLHPSNHVYFPWSDAIAPVMRRIEETGLPVLWHSGTYPNSSPLQIAVVARAHPRMPCILGHFGLLDYAQETFAAARLAPNVLADTSIQTGLGLLSAFVDEFGPRRLLWGSDFPLYDIPYARALPDRLRISGEDRLRVTGTNAIELFELGAPT